MKIQTSFRLDADALRVLDEMAVRYGLSRAILVQMAIIRMGRDCANNLVIEAGTGR